eukprot:Plantae.Rhodophyta-Hildenbrandia_rubra.ctg6716.p1 GENE.Plantae.Rhodophyta-Hildenbrandia_rubra.ctg6716~~Plantae.Rhodophyta-Hildenbrandia_rubra.ctg6716.p1  ORF type:complete len:431 (-),score=47.18 Plantae.Rhodophyta-Hildenbrandia_rubra.ctg6716:1232-2524(-)
MSSKKENPSCPFGNNTDEKTNGDIKDERRSSNLANSSTSDEELEDPASHSDFVNVDLGYVRKVRNPRVLDPAQFPSKVGGLPSWLNSKNVPNAAAMVCGACGVRMTFVLQIYAPLDETQSGHNASFHRYLYLFCCRRKECHGSHIKFKVIRGQLPRDNSFFPYDPPETEGNDSVPLADFTAADDALYNDMPICAVCGLGASSTCGKCHKLRYCSKECQKEDWYFGHQRLCMSEKNSQTHTLAEEEILGARRKLRFPEYEISIEAHPSPEPSEAGDGDGVAEPTGTLQHVSESELSENIFKPRDESIDRDFLEFQEKLRPAPTQVLRYERGGLPFWLSKAQRCEDPGKCAACSRPRIFEFQVLPQLLYYIDVHQSTSEGSRLTIAGVKEQLSSNLDWGTLAVYTCPTSCLIEKSSELGEYVEEYVWLQPSR